MSTAKVDQELNRAKNRVCKVIEEEKEEIVRTLRTLVQIPTVVGSEGEGQKYIQGLYSALGLKVVIFEAKHEQVSRHKAFSDSGLDFKGRPNVMGILEGDPSARSLIINGHMDVVSPEPIREWKYHPWEGTRVGKRLYGRGTLDMKGGLTAGYFALRSILKADLKPQGTVVLQSVIEEEAGGGGGTLACLINGFTADGLVIPEPGMEIVVSHPGINYFRVRVVGKPAHAGRAHTGINAIGKMNQIYQALVQLDEKRGREKHYPLFEKHSERSCHLNIGTYRSGDWPSTVAAWSEIQCRISYLPGETFPEVKSEVERVIHAVARTDDWMMQHPPEVTWFGWNAEPWEQNPDDPLVRAFKACAEGVLGSPVNIIGKTAGLDTRFGQYFGIPALSFGPNGENLHGVDEYVDLDSVMDCTKVLASFILEWCGRSEIS
jgi:acetylornithine deacetylase